MELAAIVPLCDSKGDASAQVFGVTDPLDLQIPEDLDEPARCRRFGTFGCMGG